MKGGGGRRKGGGQGARGRQEGRGGEEDRRVGGGLRGGEGDSVRNQRREEHLRKKQNRLLNLATSTTGDQAEIVKRSTLKLEAG